MGSKITLGMVQINNSFSKQEYLPYSVGLFQGLAERSLKNRDDFKFLLPINKRIPIKVAVGNLLAADMVFFSVYVWNIKISLEVARQIKENKPETVIIFGGPHVPDREIEVFLRSNSFVDIACYSEGEKVFLSILENSNKCNWKKIPSISYIDEEGKFIRTAMCERISNLNDIPSPYLEGVFVSLMKKNPQTEWVALWETNRGCPFSCAYCDWGSATKNKVYAYDLERLFEEIDWFSKYKIEFIFCCDANFGILPRDIEIVKYIAENKKKYGYPKALSVQSSKNFAEHSYEIYRIMSDAGLNKGVALSLQSLNEDTLRDMKRRNISIKAFKETQQKLTSFNIETFTDLILGLPSETYESFANGTSMVIENGQHNRIQFNNLSILPNAEMGNPRYQKAFGFEIVDTKIINLHGSLSDTDHIFETQKLVVGTKTMPKPDWVKARIFGWITSLLYFDKLLQIPFIILNKLYSISFRDLIEIFMEGEHLTPVLFQLCKFFKDKAEDIQNGGAEFCESKEWLNIWWPADELILIKLCTENKLTEFYNEAERLIIQYLDKRKFSDYQLILHESFSLNQSLIKLPFQENDIDIHLSYNIWEVYHTALRGVDIPIKKERCCYTIDRTSIKWSSWEDWCREVVWYGNKRGAYIIMLSNKKIFLAGSTGMAGTGILNFILNNSSASEVRASYHITEPIIRHEEVQYVRGDLRSLEDCKKMVKGCDIAIMAAAYAGGAGFTQKFPWKHMDENLMMNKEMLEAFYLEGVNRVIFIGSAVLYQEFEGNIKEDELDLNKEPCKAYYGFAWGMRFIEKLCRFLNEKYGMEIIIVRAANIFGPYDKFNPEVSNFIPAIIRKAVGKMDPFEVWGTPDVTRDVIYSDDFARAIVMMADNDEIKFNIFNIGSGVKTTVGEVVEWALKYARHIPSQIKYAQNKPVTIKFRALDCTKAKELLGWEPLCPIEEGVKKTTEWWIENRKMWKK